MYKLVGCDLDDTLLRDDFSISDKSKEAINRAVEKGIKFVVVTGRITAAARKFVEELGLDLPYASFQGAKIIDPVKGEAIYSSELKKEKILEIIRYAEMHNIHINLYDDEKIFVKEKNKWTEYYESFAKMVETVEVGSLVDFDFKSTPKMILMDEREKLDEISNEIKGFISDDVNMFYSKTNFLEFTDKNATKGFALKLLADKWGIDRSEVIAIGDNYNDESMLRYAGLGVAVGNAEDGMKAISGYIAPSNEEDGVAHVLEKFILNE
ncbi:hypothetical protein SAMN02745751_02485 [Dethiosulfatibacter aminovorans DSM 17477]|uniref:Cof subfamily of IIB subfamily of haloacid dehalogenase superfamily/HAD-superfamily hydrolase, subfamily IIB n=1 Tax=Dethiosulfatibacter aminovorans DSM 17477 TaxID=1121476 RepID=A0A1M6J134_9FIRM|nr:Cof-type HAD-IIB family hydrolase [Dethiosulfatibacter aminovorans]SHJ40362.1 hypothetical protein SAMN02745751_02485 [Dethiosulfatibacter aminovorans DSM 17477]